MNYFKHLRDEPFQDFWLFGDDFIRHLFRQRQNTLHAIAKARRNWVILDLFLQELNREALLLPPICQWRAQTSNVTLVTPKTAFAFEFNYQVSISCSFLVEVGRPTSANTAPYLIALSVDLSIDPLISGAYSLNNPSSSWSDERRASAYADIIR